MSTPPKLFISKTNSTTISHTLIFNRTHYPETYTKLTLNTWQNYSRFLRVAWAQSNSKKFTRKNGFQNPNLFFRKITQTDKIKNVNKSVDNFMHQNSASKCKW